MLWILLFIALPLADMTALLWVAERIGGLNTLFLVIFTGVLGANLARLQGFRVWQEVQNDLAKGKMPADSVLSGMLVLVGAAFLLTPGILTDTIGFLLMIPPARALLAGIVKVWAKKRVRIEGTFQAPFAQPPLDGHQEIRDAEGVRVVSDEDFNEQTDQPG